MEDIEEQLENIRLDLTNIINYPQLNFIKLSISNTLDDPEKVNELLEIYDRLMKSYAQKEIDVINK